MVKSSRLRSKTKTQNGLTRQKVKKRKRDIKTSPKNVSAFATYLSETVQRKNEEKNETTRVTAACEVEQQNEKIKDCEDSNVDQQDLFVEESSFEETLNLAESSCAEDTKTDINDANYLSLSYCEQNKDILEANPEEGWTIIPLDPDRSRVLLLLHNECKGVKIFGCGYIESLRGVASVFGVSITPNLKKRKFYAPVTHYAFVVKPSIETSDQVLNLEEYKITDQARDLCRNSKFILLLSCLDDYEENSCFPGYQELYKVRQSDGVILSGLNKGTYIVETPKFFKEYQEYGSACVQMNEFVELESRRPVILTVGGKGTGKSTFNRFLVNKLFQKSSKIYYLDCDIGQPEFTPSGFVSLTLVDDYLLGPPFTHSLSPFYSIYYGNITPTGLPDFYMECIKNVMKALPNNSHPVVVNAMGWNKALGLHLLIDTIRIVNPTHIVQIFSPKGSKNLPLLTPSYVQEASGWVTDSGSIQPTHEIITMNVDVFNTEIVVYKPSDLRELRLLANLRKLQTSCLKNYNSIPRLSLQSLSCIQPYKAFCKDLVLCVAHENAIKSFDQLALFNASVVALCGLSDKKFQSYKNENSIYLPCAPVCQCLGLGLVRGVDPIENALYIVSSLCEEQMQSVNCLVVGSLTIPESIVQESMKNKEYGQLPYTSQGLFQAKGSSKFRVYRNFT